MGRTRLTHEQFIERMKHRTDIEVVGQYRAMKHNIEVRCLKCGRQYDANPFHLLNGKGTGCFKCAWTAAGKKAAEQRKGNYNEYAANGNGTVTIDLSTKECPNSFMLMDDIDWDRLKETMYGRATAMQPATIKYAVAKIGDKQVRIHRWLLGAKPGECVDHVNGNGLDNRRSNIRKCTISENNCNLNTIRRSETGIKGITLTQYVSKKTGKRNYVAFIKKDGVKYRLGTFKTLGEAIVARLEAENKYHGEFKFNDIVDKRPAR